MLVVVTVGVYPGSFNPLTVAHLAVADAARTQAGLDHVDLVMSRVVLAKENVERPRLEDRLEVLRRATASRGWLSARVTDAQLLADIAAGYDVLVLGADKWHQLHDPAFYGGSVAERDAALARLPRLVVVARRGFVVPPGAGTVVLSLPPELAAVSSTEVRHGRWEWMAPEAAGVDAETGAWTDPDRYDRVLAERARTHPRP